MRRRPWAAGLVFVGLLCVVAAVTTLSLFTRRGAAPPSTELARAVATTLPGPMMTAAPSPAPGLRVELAPRPLDDDTWEALGMARQPGPPPATRTGARLVAAIRDQGYYASYEPQTSVGLPRLERAARGRSFAFEVRPFEEEAAEAVPGGFRVERAGEILAAAIALQLEAMGFKVGMQLPEALVPLQELLGERFRIDLGRFSQRPAFSGAVCFSVSHSRTGDGHATTAIIKASVEVVDPDGRSLYRGRFHASESASAQTLSGAAERARTTARAALAKLVAALFADPKLESSMLAYLGRRAAGRQ